MVTPPSFSNPKTAHQMTKTVDGDSSHFQCRNAHLLQTWILSAACVFFITVKFCLQQKTHFIGLTVFSLRFVSCAIFALLAHFCIAAPAITAAFTATLERDSNSWQIRESSGSFKWIILGTESVLAGLFLGQLWTPNKAAVSPPEPSQGGKAWIHTERQCFLYPVQSSLFQLAQHSQQRWNPKILLNIFLFSFLKITLPSS